MHIIYLEQTMKDSTETLWGPLRIILLASKEYVISVIANYFLSFFSSKMSEQYKEIALLSIRQTEFDFSTRI